MSSAANITSPGFAAVPGADERVDPARVVAFLAMCFGMFMAFLDIQIVSASLARDPGRPRRLERRDHLGADRLPDGRGGRHSAVRLSVARARHPHHVLYRRRRVHGREPDVRAVDDDGPDDRLARAAGLHRRRHGADRVRLRLHHLPALAHGGDHAADRARGDAGADHRPDRRRLSDRSVLLALAVLHQHRARHHRHHRGGHAHRFRPARSQAVRELRLGRPHLHGAVSRRARIRARRRAALRLVRGFDDLRLRDGVGRRRRGVLPPRAHGAAADRRSARLRRSQFRRRQRVLVRARHRPLRPDLPLSDLSQPDPRPQRADDRRDHVRLRRDDVLLRADRRPAGDAARSAR